MDRYKRETGKRQRRKSERKKAHILKVSLFGRKRKKYGNIKVVCKVINRNTRNIANRYKEQKKMRLMWNGCQFRHMKSPHFSIILFLALPQSVLPISLVVSKNGTRQNSIAVQTSAVLWVHVPVSSCRWADNLAQSVNYRPLQNVWLQIMLSGVIDDSKLPAWFFF